MIVLLLKKILKLKYVNMRLLQVDQNKNTKSLTILTLDELGRSLKMEAQLYLETKLITLMIKIKTKKLL